MHKIPDKQATLLIPELILRFYTVHNNSKKITLRDIVTESLNVSHVECFGSNHVCTMYIKK